MDSTFMTITLSVQTLSYLKSGDWSRIKRDIEMGALSNFEMYEYAKVAV